jgi:predicted permease
MGIMGWGGAAQFGFLPAAIGASLLTLGLLWAIPRLRLLNPVRAHWVRPASSWLDGIYRNIWGLYHTLGRVSATVTATLEGASGVMWTLLFLVLFISLMTQGTR